MYSSNPGELPIEQLEEEERGYKRHQSGHQSARYLAQRVKESLTTRLSKMICTIFLFILFITGLIFFILYLSLKPHRPRFFVQDFQIPGMDQPNGFQNVAAMYNVTIRNSDRKIVTDFDSVYGRVYYREQSIGGSPMLSSPFEMEPKSTKIMSSLLNGVTMTVGSIGWGEFLNDRTAGSVLFRLDMTSLIKFQVYSWDSKKHKMHASCDVAVAANGFLLDTYKNKRCRVYFS